MGVVFVALENRIGTVRRPFLGEFGGDKKNV